MTVERIQIKNGTVIRVGKKKTSHIGDIFRSLKSKLLSKKSKLNSSQRKTVEDICRCKTIECGIHTVAICDECGAIAYTYGSCGNRNCPICGSAASKKWVEKETEYLLPVTYFHVVFTLPSELNSLCLNKPSLLYNILFKASSQTLLELSADEQYLGAKPGITAVLHTWGQKMDLHPHIHMIVTGGGLTSDMEWKSSEDDFFLPVHVMSSLFRGKFMSLLKKNIPDLDPNFVDDLYNKTWNVYCKPPFNGDPNVVVKYLARYVNKICITDSRIVSVSDSSVVFRYHDYRDDKNGTNNKADGDYYNKQLTLTKEEFARRFLMHVLPPRFTRIRHYGIAASRNKKKRLTLCRKLTNPPNLQPPLPPPIIDAPNDRLYRCPYCNNGFMIRPPPFVELLLKVGIWSLEEKEKRETKKVQRSA